MKLIDDAEGFCAIGRRRGSGGGGSECNSPGTNGAGCRGAGSAGRRIRFASIGTGIRGCDLLRSARKVPTGDLRGHSGPL